MHIDLLDFDRITEEDVLLHVESNPYETTTNEYKRELMLDGNEAKKKFLSSVASFSNSNGGYIFYGVDGGKELQSSIIGIDHANGQKLLDRIASMVQDNIDPKIGYQARLVGLQNGNSVLVLKVQGSMNRPHMVTFDKTNKFYHRVSGTKALMDVHQLRDSFNRNGETIDLLRAKRDGRLDAIFKDKLQYRLQSGPKLVVHVYPFTQTSTYYDFSKVGKSIYINLLGGSITRQRPNVDGYAVFDIRTNESRINGYAQLYRTGVVESVVTLNPTEKSDTSFFIFGTLEDLLISEMPNYLTTLSKLSVSLPLYVSISLIGAKGIGLYNGRDVYFTVPEYQEMHCFDRDILSFEAPMVESYNTDIHRILRPVFDLYYASAGYYESNLYDEEGNYIKNKK